MSRQLENNYAGVFDTHLTFGKKPALILIDMVRAYFDADCVLFLDKPEVLESAARIRDIARENNVPIFYTNVSYHPSMKDAGRFYEKTKPLEIFKQGSKWGDWLEILTPADDELVITKQYPSSFFGTSLAATLTAQGVDCVMLGGVSTSGCVRATCIDACSSGFTTFIAEDACGDRHPDPHKANLFDMQAKYAEVVNENEAIRLLNSV